MEYNKIKTIIVIFILLVGFFAVVIEPALSFDPPPPPPVDEYVVTVRGAWFRSSSWHYFSCRSGRYAIYHNGNRIMTGTTDMGTMGNPIDFVRSFSTIEAINSIGIVETRGARRRHYLSLPGDYSLTGGTVTITRQGTVLYHAHGLHHSPNLPPIPIPMPPIPTFQLPPSPILTPPAVRPAFFNYTILFSFFDFVDNIFLPFAQTLLNVLWIPLSLIDFINQVLVGFWYFFDNHVIYGGFLDVLGFLYIFFEIPEVLLLMVFGLSLVVIKIFLKR